MVFLTLLVVLPASSPPTVTIFDSTSNVYGRAYPAKDSGVVRFLGTFNTTAGCQHACVGYHAAKDGAVCHSFTFHHADFPQAAFAGACFAIADHSWQPNSPADKITSGRVAWPMDGCGAGVASGCLWQVDPICLASGGDMTLQPVQLTVAQAIAGCGSATFRECVGFTFSGAANTTGLSTCAYATERTRFAAAGTAAGRGSTQQKGWRPMEDAL